MSEGTRQACEAGDVGLTRFAQGRLAPVHTAGIRALAAVAAAIDVVGVALGALVHRAAIGLAFHVVVARRVLRKPASVPETVSATVAIGVGATRSSDWYLAPQVNALACPIAAIPRHLTLVRRASGNWDAILANRRAPPAQLHMALVVTAVHGHVIAVVALLSVIESRISAQGGSRITSACRACGRPHCRTAVFGTCATRSGLLMTLLG